MCGSLLAPKAPSMPAPLAPAPRVSELPAESAVNPTQAVDPVAAQQPVAVENPEPQFQAGSEIDDLDALEATKGTKRLQTHSKTDTGLAIPL